MNPQNNPDNSHPSYHLTGLQVSTVDAIIGEAAYTELKRDSSPKFKVSPIYVSL